MTIPPGTIFILIGCGVVLLILWNLRRYSNALSTRAFLLAALLVVAAGAAAQFALSLREHRRFADVEKRLVLAPFLHAEGDTLALTAEGLAFADMLAAQLRSSGRQAIHVLPVESLFEIAALDSLSRPGYLVHLAGELGLDYVGRGVYHRANGHLQLEFQLYAAGRLQPLFQEDAAAAGNHAPAAIAEIKTKTLQHLDISEPHNAQAQSPAHLLPADPRYYQAYLEFLRGDYAQAAPAARALAASDSLTPEFAVLAARSTLQHLARLRLSERAWQDSLRPLIPVVAAAVQRDTLRAETWLALGQCYLYARKWNEADQALRRAFARDSLHSKIYLRFAQLHASRLGELGFEDEYELCAQALALNPLDVEAAIATANQLLLENRREEAVALLEKYRRLNPNHLPVLMMLGRIYLTRNDLLQILPLYEHILKLDPRNADAYYNLGIAYYNQDDFDTAIRLFERALRLNDHADARLYLAYIYEKRQEMDRAIQYLRERIRLSTGDHDTFAGEAREHLYNLLLQRGEVPENLLPEKLEKK